MSVQAFGTIAKAATPRYVRRLFDETGRYHVIIAALRKKGRIELNCDGNELTWRVRYKRHPLTTYQDAQQVQFARRDLYKSCTVDWRAYDMNTAVTKQELLSTKGANRLFKLYGQKAEELKDDFIRELAGKFFQDGANGQDFIGIEGCLAGTYAAGSTTGTANGTYAGLNQTLGAYGGTSLADVQYGFWTPTLINWNSTAWPTSPAGDFSVSALWAIRKGITKTMRRNSRKEKIDVVDLNIDLWESFLNAYMAKETFYVDKGRKSLLGALGFQSVWFDGVEVTWEEDVPANTGYGLNFDKMKLCVQNDKVVDGQVEWDIKQKAWLMDVDVFGQLQFFPQHLFKLYVH